MKYTYVMVIFGLPLLIVAILQSIEAANQLKQLQLNHRFQRLTNGQIKQLANLSNIQYFNTVLDKILIPRVASTESHETVFQFIKSELKKSGWNVDVDEFEDDTPNFGRLTFKNIIGTLNSNADRYLVLACHYDSKYFPDEVFIGAIDSAVPCSMILNLINVLQNELITLKNQTAFNLKLIFFDGEEALKDWGPNDSIYGARHLAKVYDRNKNRLQTSDEIVSDLAKIDVLVLLDLLGHANVNFYNFFPETTRWYTKMADIEDKLQILKLFLPRRTKYFIRRDFFNGRIEDDHIPFLRKNVPILHVIPIPFPPEWHTVNDNRDIVDINTVENLNKILRIFVVQYLHISRPDGIEESIPEKEL